MLLSPAPRPTDITQWQEIGWNGISLKVPDIWHPAVILERYLLFEEDYHPVFEIRWGETHGHFSAGRVIRKLERSLGDSHLVPWQPPPEWLGAFAKCRVHGFQWCQAEANGRGLLIHNPASTISMLLRFHQAGSRGDAHYATLLSSLRQQPPDEEHTWAIFDIHARLPSQTRLLRQRFLPGSYTIDFRLDHLFVSLLRFKPAAELLNNRTLADFGDALANDCRRILADDPLEITWRSNDSAPWRLLRRLQRKKACHLLTLWQLSGKNVILGLRCTSNKTIPFSRVQAIRARYTAR